MSELNRNSYLVFNFNCRILFLPLQHLQRYPSYDPYSLQQQSKDLDVKMQEFQYETASVRAQLTEAASASKMELDDLTRKLAETELDAERHKQAFLDEAQRQQQVIEDVGKKLADKRGDYDELKLKYKTKEKVRKRWGMDEAYRN